MTRLKGRFDGKVIVLEQPVPLTLKANTIVDVLVSDERENALAAMEEFMTELWQRPVPDSSQIAKHRFSREDLHDRR